MAPVVTMKQLLEAGVHFGHQTRRWNPKMQRFIFGERNGIYIIDLQQTLARIETAYSFVRDLVADGGSVLFIGTKKQAQDPIQSYAERCGMPYVNERWLGGMLTNFETIAKRVEKMQEYERMRATGEFDAMPKKEALILGRELVKLQRNLGGLRSMTKLPEAVFILDTKKEHIAVTEANKLHLPIVAVVDTNCDPDVIQYVIPGNDDAIRSGTLMCRILADAVDEGRFIAARRNPRAAGGPPPRDAADDARIAAEQAEARKQAAAAAADREARVLAARQKALTEEEQPAAEPATAESATAEPATAEPVAVEVDAPAAVEVDAPTAEAPGEASAAVEVEAPAGDIAPAASATESTEE
jgi:small subunit ribosomal protein S2